MASMEPFTGNQDIRKDKLMDARTGGPSRSLLILRSGAHRKIHDG